jgi:rare lipoprotein A
MTSERVKTMYRIIVLCVILLLQTGCGVPEFAPPPPPPPQPIFGESITGAATWYGSMFHGRATSNGEQFDMENLTASHGSLPFGTVVEITNPENGKTARVVINDRHNLEGVYQLCISKKAAQQLEIYPQKKFTVNFMVIE